MGFRRSRRLDAQESVAHADLTRRSSLLTQTGRAGVHRLLSAPPDARLCGPVRASPLVRILPLRLLLRLSQRSPSRRTASSDLRRSPVGRFACRRTASAERSPAARSPSEEPARPQVSWDQRCTPRAFAACSGSSWLSLLPILIT